MNIVLPDGAACMSSPEDLAPLREIGSVKLYDALPAGKSDLIERVKDADSVILDYSKMDAEVMARCPRLRFICFLGIGYNAYVDVREASRRGIAVTYTPNYGSVSVAEHAMAMAMALARRLLEVHRSVERGEWTPGRFQGMELRGKIMGVVGLGPIGMEMVRIASGMGMRISAWTKNPDPLRKRYGLEYATLERLFDQADVVSLHLAHTPETERIISGPLLRRMKEGAFLVNTSRAQLVDNKVLLELLESGHLGGVGMDVFEEEPLPPDSPFKRFSNVILSPHLAFNTREASANMIRIAVENVVAFSRGERLNPVT